MRSARHLLVILPLATLTCDPGSDSPGTGAEPSCGDGVLDEGEQCDDGNLDDGDGCSSTCEVDYPEPACVTLLETPDAIQTSALVTNDGQVLICGQLAGSNGELHAWVGAFDTQGQQLWSLELEDKAMAQGVTRTDGGFVFIAYTPAVATDLITIDDSGTVTNTYTLPVADPSVGTPIALLDTSAGLWLGGVNDADMWLAQLGDDGLLSTLVLEDHVGLDERFVSLAQQGTSVAALAQVGISNYSDGDNIEFDTLDTWLIEYDEQGQEQRRTVFSSGLDRISMSGTDIAVDGQGTWLVTGTKAGNNTDELGSIGWAAAVRDGEVAWSFEAAATIPGQDQPPVYSSLFSAALGSSALLAGQTRAADSMRRWSVRLDAMSGALLTQHVGPAVEVGPDTFTFGDGTNAGQAWFVGYTREQEGVEQWLCGASI